MRAEALIDNWYEIQRNLSLEVARDFILNTKLRSYVVISFLFVPKTPLCLLPLVLLNTYWYVTTPIRLEVKFDSLSFDDNNHSIDNF
ncbi:MAG TPA: hypothetical protein DCL61_31205 [Cyanobacteria bacterium UBA12227]|nr:hypothetical protein [Cyanobacteria bacterium UBA12227]HAX85141.1 hypothetical protein [Cyanobacteria bacterium UBA11370]HBY77688.1 hypothetical protein [Cyanobacteria bacterium UBA11148]